MKSNLKRISVALLLLSLLLVLTSCGGPEATYKSANNLLAKGKYAEAAEKFASLGSYEDAAYLTIYADACAKGESDDPYVIMDAISIFSDLSGFKDSNMRATYYWGRFCENRGRYFENANAGDGFQFMEQALEYYESISLFLDCPTRIKALENELPPLMENAYNDAINKAEAGNYAAADELFEKLDDYKDSKTRITYYDIREAEDALTYSTDQDAVVVIAKRYSALDEFLDCSNREEAMYAKADKIVADKYAQAAALTAEGKCADADATLSAFGKYGNSKVNDYYVAIAEKYLDLHEWDKAYYAYQDAGLYDDARKAFYIQAETLMAEEKWEEASAAFSRAAYGDSKSRIKEPYYKQAEKLLTSGEYAKAYSVFLEISGYKDSASRARTIFENYWQKTLETATVGGSILFGTYEQDGWTSNGSEGIEWLVLAKEDNRLLVISRYALDEQEYDTQKDAATWETSTLRKWLNSTFFYTAFNSTQQALIPTVTVAADKNPEYSTNPGRDTQDKVFLLSILEVNKYFSSESAMDCKASAYAEDSGADTYNGICNWWLRSPGKDEEKAACVDKIYGVSEYGRMINYVFNENAVRPAIWIELKP